MGNKLIAIELKDMLFRPIETLAPVVAHVKNNLDNNDSAIVKRIIKAYQLGIHVQENRGNSLWASIFNEHHMAIHKVFENGDFAQAKEILCNPESTDLLYGIDNLCNFFLPHFSNPIYLHGLAALSLDGLVRFAEAIGAVRMDNPENSPPSMPWTAAAVLKKIEQKLGQSLSFPNPYPNEYGIQTVRGLVSLRAPQALYQAWRLKQLLKGIESPKVLEIGAGLGRTAYYARMLGIQDYTIVDLPLTLLASGYFLARTLGDDQVVLFGENVADSNQKVKFLTPAAFLSSNDSYDLIINADSLTEMDLNVARDYFKRIESGTEIFVSMNHEGNPFTVKELIDESARVVQVNRSPYWMRQGYTEEIIRFTPMPQSK